MPNRPWKKEELDLLLFLRSKKRKIFIQGRSSKSIRRKLIALGIEKPVFKIKHHKKIPWTNEEIELVKKGFHVPGRSRESTRSMSIRLGVIKQKKGSRTPWKKKQEKILVNLAKQHRTAKEIFDMKVLPYSKNSIQKKMCYMGLAKKRSIPSVKFTNKESFAFKKFLLENYQGKTPDELLEEWNNKFSPKANRSKILYYLNALKIKIPYYEVARINKLRKKEEAIKNMSHKSQKALEESIRLARISIMRKRLSQGKDLWTGLCSEEAKEDFKI